MSLNIEQKVEHAVAVIEGAVRRYRNPCLLMSFGKDSMLLMAMLRNQCGMGNIPVVHFRQPGFARRWAFADRMISEWKLKVHFAPAQSASIIVSRDGKATEVVFNVQMDQGNVLRLPMGKLPIDGVHFACARDDFMQGPFGMLAWPWDVAFSGHKGFDQDEVHGNVGVKCDVRQQGPFRCALAYPLRMFGDDEVWELLERWKVPINELRYEKDAEGKWGVAKDRSFDSDYVPYCMRCVESAEPVECPRDGCVVAGMRRGVNVVDFDAEFADHVERWDKP